MVSVSVCVCVSITGADVERFKCEQLMWDVILRNIREREGKQDEGRS